MERSGATNNHMSYSIRFSLPEKHNQRELLGMGPERKKNLVAKMLNVVAGYDNERSGGTKSSLENAKIPVGPWIISNVRLDVV